MFGWGCFTIAHGFIKNEATLIAYRLMIGAFEAGYFPTCACYFGMMYVRFDLAYRLGIFFVSIDTLRFVVTASWLDNLAG
jgi:hypothetical protein